MPDTKYPRVAVVILCWNGRKFLEQFIPLLLKTTYPNVEMYVADNCSTDDSVTYLRENFPSVNIIALKENLGFPNGYNTALKEVGADYYVLLNQDVEVTPGWIEPVIALMEEKPNCAACQPKLKAFKQKTDFEYAGAAGGYMDIWGYAFCKGRLFDAIETDTGQYNTPAEIFWACGAAMFIKADLYHKIGGMDIFFFAHMEEIDLCWRLKNAGYSIWYCPDSAVYHVGGGSLPQGNPRKTYLNFRNNLILIYKNIHGIKVFFILAFRMWLDFIAIMRSLAMGNMKDAAAINRAHRHFVRNIPWFGTARNEAAQKVREMSIGPVNRKGIYFGSIVWQFFVCHKKKFSQLPARRFK